VIQKLRPFGVYGMSGLGDFLDSFAQAQISVEGYNPNFAGNNNPGNLIYVKNGWNYPGATPGAGGFAHYPDYATGLAALKHQIQVQFNSGQNLVQFINQFAPAGTKNDAGGAQTSVMTQNYITRMQAALGIDPTVPLIQYQNGTAQSNVSTPDAITNESVLVTDTSTLPSSADEQSSGVVDTLSGMDPVLVGAITVLSLGTLYVLFG
jgi:hypothetical protein